MVPCFAPRPQLTLPPPLVPCLLQQLDHCRFWDSLWYHLFARLAKHDVHGKL